MPADRQSRIGGTLSLRVWRRGGFVGNSQARLLSKSEKGSLVMTPRTHGVHSPAV
jgi:hypothetical protein